MITKAILHIPSRISRTALVLSLLVCCVYPQWTRKDLAVSADLYDICFASRLYGIIIGDQTLLRTTDGGVHWKSVAFSGMGELWSAVSPSPHSYVAVGYTYGGAVPPIFRSTDDGSSWKRIPAIADGRWSVHFPSRSVGYAVCGSAVVLKTTDGGTTWSTSLRQLDGQVFGIWFRDDTHGFAVGSDGLVVKTSDGGNQWTPLPPMTGQDLFSIQFTDRLSGIIMGDNELFRTTDGGQTWSEQYIEETPWQMKFLDGHTGYAVGYVRVPGGGWTAIIMKTSDGGETWSTKKIPEYTFFTAVHFPTTTTGYVVGGQGRIYKTTDAGGSWQRLSVDSSYGNNLVGDFRSVHFVDSLRGFAAGTYGIMLRTVDGGKTWTNTSLWSWPGISEMKFFSPDTAMAIGDRGEMYWTANGGTSWNYREKGVGWAWQDVAFLGERLGWIVGEGGKVMKTVDGGVSWNSKNVGVSDYLRGVGFADSLHGFIVADGSCFSTVDGGETWQRVYLPLFGYRSVKFIDDKNGFISATGGMLATTDGGAKWTARSYGMDAQTSDLVFFTPSRGYALAGLGGKKTGALGTTDAGRTWTTEWVDSSSGSFLYSMAFPNQDKGFIVGSGGRFATTDDVFELLQNYPNPFNAGTVISYYLPVSTQIEVKVYNVLGQEIMTLAEGEQPRGLHLLRFDASAPGVRLSSGVYFYRLVTDQFTKTGKMLLVK